jgi:hypothetical protein
MQIWLFFAAADARCNALTALSLFPLSTGTPPNARDIQLKKGTMKSSFFARAKWRIGHVADTRKPSKLLEWLKVRSEHDSEKLFICFCDLSGPLIISTDTPDSSNISHAILLFSFSESCENGPEPMHWSTTLKTIIGNDP